MRNAIKKLTIISAMGFVSVAAQAGGPRGGGVEAAREVDSLRRARALHVLNRLTYGPRPGDVDMVSAMGVDRFVQMQLHPERISDPEVAAAIARFAVLEMPSSEMARIDREFRVARRQQQRADTVQSPPPEERRRQTAGRPNEVRRLIVGFQQAAVVRAVISNRQLYEVMVDFWTNHFNVFMGKGADRFLTPEYIEKTIRPNALGRFEDLLIATAQSPAMLFYLDNASSVAPGSEPPQLARMERAMDRQRARAGANPRQTDRLRDAEERMAQMRQRLPSDINENYAREILELHTLGVDAGYSQQDVINVARILTGWGIDRLGQGRTDFTFHEWAHDDGSKTVMGVEFPGGNGMDEGVRLLEMLARHPATMRHISSKLCVRFVNDTPPEGCVEAGAAAWERTDGDIRAVVQAVVTSPEFWAETNRGAKTKTPLEFVVSAVRALGAAPDTTPRLAQVVRRLGQPLYFQSAPTGYPEVQDDWVNSGALLERMNIALGFAAGRVPGVRVRLDSVAPVTNDVDELVRTVNENILSGTASETTLRVMKEQAASARNGREARTLAVGLALGSPEFQRQD